MLHYYFPANGTHEKPLEVVRILNNIYPYFLESELGGYAPKAVEFDEKAHSIILHVPFEGDKKLKGRIDGIVRRGMKSLGY
ncbi:MAG: hypothetical protein HY513_00140 [Candidatus Aenigmarchaeota archaeon]|nr:hypothetical protein [Candidatus Aenigmarchaeota archaeon]